MKLKKLSPKIIFLVAVVVLLGGYAGVNALTGKQATPQLPPAEKPVINPASTGQTVSLDTSTWKTFKSEGSGRSLKYPQEWTPYLTNPTGSYSNFVSPNDRCTITLGSSPADTGQTVDKWFTEKEEPGGFHAEIISKEFIKVANKRSILVEFAKLTQESYERRLAGKSQLGPVLGIGLYVPLPKEDLIFSLTLGVGDNEESLPQECRNVFDIMIETLNFNEKKS